MRAWPGTKAEVSVAVLDSTAEEPAPRTGDLLPAVPALKPLLRGWLHLISFEASLVLGTLARPTLASATGPLSMGVDRA